MYVFFRLVKLLLGDGRPSLISTLLEYDSNSDFFLLCSSRVDFPMLKLLGVSKFDYLDYPFNYRYDALVYFCCNGCFWYFGPMSLLRDEFVAISFYFLVDEMI